MELFALAKAVRLKSHHDKFLYADEDEVHVTQDRNGASSNARWSVEAVPGNPRVIRLRSRYCRYLSASAEPFLLGMTGWKVTQTAAAAPGSPDPSVEWEPVRDGFQARLKTRSGHFLRANGELPPWRNSVTHDVPHRTATQDWVLWDVETVQVLTPGPERADSAPVKMPDSPPPLPEISGPAPAPHHRPSESYAAPHAMEPAARLGRKLSKRESSDFFFGPLHELEGRAIHYHIADHLGNVDDGIEGHSFTFYGSNLEELTHKLQEETGLDDIMVCTRSPINGKLTPLHLQLPPNNAAMHIVLVQESSKDSAPLKMPDSPPPPEISYPPLPPHHRPSRFYLQRKMACALRAPLMRHRRWAWSPEGRALRKDWGLSMVKWMVQPVAGS